jgi:lysozyme-like protein
VTTCQGAKGTGTLYSYAGLEGLWVNAGGPKAYAPIMAAIATAESGGCSTAYNPSGATGLWQILGAVDPADQPRLTDPAVNAKEAVLKFRDQGLGAWVTYTSGAYKQYLNGSVPPDLNVKGSGGGAAAAQATAYNAADCLFGIPEIDLKVTSVGGACLFSKSAGREALGGLLIAGGGLVLALGVLVLVAYGLRGTKAGQAATGAVAGAARAPGVAPVVQQLVKPRGPARERSTPAPARQRSSAG